MAARNRALTSPGSDRPDHRRLSSMIAVVAGVSQSHPRCGSVSGPRARQCSKCARATANSTQPCEAIESSLLSPFSHPVVRASCGESDDPLSLAQPAQLELSRLHSITHEQFPLAGSRACKKPE